MSEQQETQWVRVDPRGAAFGGGARVVAGVLCAVMLAACHYDSYAPKLPALPTYTIQQLGLLTGGAQSQANSGSAAIIVGWATNGAGTRHAVLFTGGTAMALQEPAGAVSSEARGVNAAGNIVGFSTNGAGVRQALLWVSTTSAPTLLASLGGAYSFAAGINDQSIIVGTAQSDTGDTVLVTWQQGDSSYVPTPVDTTGAGVDAQPVAINDDPEIAGNLAGGAGGLFWDVNDGWDTVTAPAAGTPVVHGLSSTGIEAGGVIGITPEPAFVFTTNLGSVTVGTPPAGYTDLEADAVGGSNGIIAGRAFTVDGSGNTLTSVPVAISVTLLTAPWTPLATLGGPQAQPADNAMTPCGVILGWATTTAAPSAPQAVAWVPTGCTIP